MVPVAHLTITSITVVIIAVIYNYYIIDQYNYVLIFSQGNLGTYISSTTYITTTHSNCLQNFRKIVANKATELYGYVHKVLLYIAFKYALHPDSFKTAKM